MRDRQRQNRVDALLLRLRVRKQFARGLHYLRTPDLPGQFDRNLPHLEEPVVRKQQATRGVIGIVGEHTIGRGIEGAPQVLQTVGQRLARGFMVRDVARDRHHLAATAAPGAIRRQPGFHMPPPAARQIDRHPDHAQLAQLHALAKCVCLNGLAPTRQQVAAGPANDLLAAKAHRAAPGIVDQQVNAVLVHQADHVADRVDDELGRGQGLPGAVDQGQVREHADHAHLFTLHVGDRGGVHQAVQPGSIWTLQGHFQSTGRVGRRRKASPEQLRVGVVEEREHRATNNVFRLAVEHGTHCRVDIGGQPGTVHEPEAKLGRALHCRQQLLLVGQRGLGQAALGDILHRPQHARRAPGAVKQHLAATMDVAQAAVGAADPIVEVVVSFAAQGLLQELLQPFAVIGKYSSNKTRVSGRHTARLQAPQPVMFVRPLQRTRHRIPIEAAQLRQPLGLPQLQMAAPQGRHAQGLRSAQGHIHLDRAMGTHRHQCHINEKHQGRERQHPAHLIAQGEQTIRQGQQGRRAKHQRGLDVERVGRQRTHADAGQCQHQESLAELVLLG